MPASVFLRAGSQPPGAMARTATAMPIAMTANTMATTTLPSAASPAAAARNSTISTPIRHGSGHRRRALGAIPMPQMTAAASGKRTASAIRAARPELAFAPTIARTASSASSVASRTASTAHRSAPPGPDSAEPVAPAESDPAPSLLTATRTPYLPASEQLRAFPPPGTHIWPWGHRAASQPRATCRRPNGFILGSVTTGWNNQQAIDKVNRTLKGGSSGRGAVPLIAAAFLALGVYTGHLWLSVPFGIATAIAAWAVVSARRNDLAARRMERRGLDRR